MTDPLRSSGRTAVDVRDFSVNSSAAKASGRLSDGTSVTLGAPQTAPPQAAPGRPSGVAKFFAAIREMFSDGLKSLQGLFGRGTPQTAPAPQATAVTTAAEPTTSAEVKAEPPSGNVTTTAAEPTTTAQVKAEPPSGNVTTDAAIAQRVNRQLANLIQTPQNVKTFLRLGEGNLLKAHLLAHTGDHFKTITGALIDGPGIRQHDALAHEGAFRKRGIDEGARGVSAQRCLANVDAFFEAQLGALDANGDPDPAAIRAAASRVPQALCDLLKGAHDGIDASTTPQDKNALKAIASNNYIALRLVTPDILLGGANWARDNPDATADEKARVSDNTKELSKMVTTIVNQTTDSGKEEIHPSIKDAFEARKATWGDAFKLFTAEIAARGT